MALMYRSSDLRNWEYMHPLATAKPAPQPPAGTPVGVSSMWECPDFFFLDGKPVLMVAGGNTYLTGTYENYKFEQKIEGRVDYGNAAYAQKTMADATGRRIWWGWLHEARSTKTQAAAGWAGVMSLPRILKMQSNGELGVEPASELKKLRGRNYKITGIPIKPDGPLLLQKQFSGDCVEILADIDLRHAQQVGLRVRSTVDGNEQTLVGFDRETSTIFCDTTQSSSDPETLNTSRPLSGRGIQRGPLLLQSGENVKLHVFVDASVIEIFANGRAALSDRVYPTSPESLGIGLFARGGDAKLDSFEVYDLTPISTDRLTSGANLFRV